MLRILLLALSFFSFADAGSRLWEKSLAQRVQLLQAADAQKAAAQNDNGTLHERWFVPYVPMEDPNDEHDGIWPDKTITYAWNDDDTKKTFQAHFNQAQYIWASAGLDSDVFKYDEITKAKCIEDDVSRSYCLLISTAEGYDTTPARRRSQYGKSRPSMQLVNNANIGFHDVTLNIAHELGHAWGLLHPHQNPIYWKHTAGATGVGSRFVEFDADDAEQYRCDNLADYPAVEREVTNKSGGNPDTRARLLKRVCQSFLMAGKYGFRGGANWAPYDPAIRSVGLNEHMDWTSLMIYPSNAGGARGDDGERKNILLRKNGSPIPSNRKPSDSDIQGIKYLYGMRPKTMAKLFNPNKWRKVKGPDSCNVYADPPAADDE